MSKISRRTKLSPRQRLERNLAGGRNTIFVMVFLTIVNVVIAASGGDSYYLFSAAVPYFLVLTCLYRCGLLPNYWYEAPKSEYQFDDLSTLVVPVIVAVLILLLYVLLALKFKTSKVARLVAVVMVFVDTLAVFAFYDMQDGAGDAIFHLVILTYLVVAIVSHKRLAKMPPDDEFALDAETPEDPNGAQNGDSDFNY